MLAPFPPKDPCHKIKSYKLLFLSHVSLSLTYTVLVQALNIWGPLLAGGCCSQSLPTLVYPRCSQNDSKSRITLSHAHPRMFTLFLTNKCPFVRGINPNAYPGHILACLLSALHLQPSPFSSQFINWHQRKLLVVPPTNHSHSIPLVFVFHLCSTAWFSTPHTAHLLVFPDTEPFSTTDQSGRDSCMLLLHPSHSFPLVPNDTLVSFLYLFPSIRA